MSGKCVPLFRVLGFGMIFYRFVSYDLGNFPPFRLLGCKVIFRRSVFRNWGNFPSFRLLESPLSCCADEKSAKTLCPSPPLLGLEMDSELLGIEDVIKSPKDICRILPCSTLFFNSK